MQLTHDNFELFASKFYDNINCVDMMEFYDDLNRIKYIKKIFKKYKESGIIKPRLIINHLIVLYNVFVPPKMCTKMLVLKLEDYLDCLKPFLLQLNYWVDNIELNDNKVIIGSDISLDQNIVNLLREEFKRC